MIYPVEPGGYVYHDGFNIKGVAFAPDPTLEHHEKLAIPLDMAIEFVRGERNTQEWFVWSNSVGPTLYNRNYDGVLRLDRIGDTFETIKSNPSGLCIITLYRDIQRMTVQIRNAYKLQSSLTALPFAITMKHDASATLHVFDVPLEQLLEETTVEMALPVDPTIAIDICTRRVFPSYRIETRLAKDGLSMALPVGHFVDLKRCGSTPIERGLQAVIDRSTHTIRLALVGSMVEIYERGLATLPLVFSLPDDPCMFLHGVSVPIADLQDGATLVLPAILKQPFDLWLPLLYFQTYITEA